MPKKLTISEQAVAQLASLWKPLCSEHRQMIADHLVVRSYKRKETVYRSDETPCQLFFMVSGKAIIKRDAPKQMRILRLLGANDVFGYRAHFTSSAFYSSTTCLEASIIASLPFCIVDRLVREEPSIGLFFTKELSLLLAISDTRSEVLTQMPLRGRLAQTLLYLHDKYGSSNGELNVRITREELGEMSNMNTSNAIRTLSQFTSEGLVETEGKVIRLLDKEGLRREYE